MLHSSFSFVAMLRDYLTPQVKFFPSVTGFILQMSAQTKVISQQRMAYTEMLQSDLAVRLELMARDAKYINSKVCLLVCLYLSCLLVCLYLSCLLVCLFVYR